MIKSLSTKAILDVMLIEPLYTPDGLSTASGSQIVEHLGVTALRRNGTCVLPGASGRGGPGKLRRHARRPIAGDRRLRAIARA